MSELYAFGHGVLPTTGFEKWFGIRFSGVWTDGDSWSINFVTTTGDFTVGEGNLAPYTITYGLVDGNRVFLANGQQFNFCATGDVTGWEQQNIGAGFVQYTSNFGAVDTVQSFAAYQGRLAALGRRSIQIWITDPNPASFALQQTLSNIGTYAPDSVQSLGELDVIFLSDTGIRSLRVRDSSLNGYIVDLGSAVDSHVLEAVEGATMANLSSSCSVVDPTTNRYWLYLNTGNPTTDLIYVLSYFPTLKIIAWSTYSATYEDVNHAQQPFVPQKFVIFEGQIYVRDANSFYLYGPEHDNAQAVVEIPFLSGGGKKETPATQKTLKGIDVFMDGAWDIGVQSDWHTLNYESAYTGQTESTVDSGTIPISLRGTHFSFQAKTRTNDRNPALLSSLIVHYEPGEETA